MLLREVYTSLLVTGIRRFAKRKFVRNVLILELLLSVFLLFSFLFFFLSFFSFKPCCKRRTFISAWTPVSLETPTEAHERGTQNRLRHLAGAKIDLDRN